MTEKTFPLSSSTIPYSGSFFWCSLPLLKHCTSPNFHIIHTFLCFSFFFMFHSVLSSSFPFTHLTSLPRHRCLIAIEGALSTMCEGSRPTNATYNTSHPYSIAGMQIWTSILINNRTDRYAHPTCDFPKHQYPCPPRVVSAGTRNRVNFVNFSHASQHRSLYCEELLRLYPTQTT